MRVPFYRPSIGPAEIDAVTACLQSGWLTTGPRCKHFEAAFAERLGVPHAVAVNSCTAALHLALDAIGLRRGDMVLVPAMTFAATAEVVRYFDATPVFVDADPRTLCLDVNDAARVAARLRAEAPVAGLKPPYGPLRAIIPMHYGGQMADMDAVHALARSLDIRVIEDAAHTLPAFIRSDAGAPWRSVGTTSELTCFSFYANKCITTGEGGMLVTTDAAYAERARLMALHGMSKDGWKRFSEPGAWYYEIVAPGYKYNLTDLAAAIGLVQLERSDALWQQRCRLADRYRAGLATISGLTLPEALPHRQHSWHLFTVRLDPNIWRAGRNAVMAALAEAGIATSVHWMPLPLHPYYQQTYSYAPGTFPVAERLWPQLISLPLFPGMTEAEQDYVIATLVTLARAHG